MKIILHIFVFTLLTVVTQTGGAIYLLYLLLKGKFKKIAGKYSNFWIIRFAVFFVFYIFINNLLIPPLAKWQGRVRLPAFSSQEMPLKPRNMFTVLANRHYVKPALETLVRDAALKFRKTHPKAELLYLDANFPFWDGFPLLPHHSHSDGRKIDLSFRYSDKDQKLLNSSPSFLGYGACEIPEKGEFDMPANCEKKGHWQYSILQKFYFGNKNIQFDEKSTSELIRFFAKDKRTGMIFIEPHLKTRLGLRIFGKIRFHGCRAVRHDDHIHVQL